MPVCEREKHRERERERERAKGRKAVREFEKKAMQLLMV